MQLDFDEATHTYTLDGRRVPSVTQALSVLDAYQAIPAAVLADARLRGQWIHSAIELHAQDELDLESVPDVVRPYFDGWLRFCEDASPTVILSEQRVFHPVIQFAGAYDMIATLGGGRPVLLDVKSGLLPLHVGPQTAAYRECILRARPAWLKGERLQRRCLQLDPKLPRGYRLHQLNDPADWSVFLSCLTVYRWRGFSNNPETTQ